MDSVEASGPARLMARLPRSGKYEADDSTSGRRVWRAEANEADSGPCDRPMESTPEHARAAPNGHCREDAAEERFREACIPHAYRISAFDSQRGARRDTPMRGSCPASTRCSASSDSFCRAVPPTTAWIARRVEARAEPAQQSTLVICLIILSAVSWAGSARLPALARDYDRAIYMS